jgi:hypothetical protein
MSDLASFETRLFEPLLRMTDVIDGIKKLVILKEAAEQPSRRTRYR